MRPEYFAVSTCSPAPAALHLLTIASKRKSVSNFQKYSPLLCHFANYYYAIDNIRATGWNLIGIITLGEHVQRGDGSMVVCVSSLSVTLHLTSRVFVRLTKDMTYLTGNEGQNNLAVCWSFTSTKESAGSTLSFFKIVRYKSQFGIQTNSILFWRGAQKFAHLTNIILFHKITTAQPRRYVTSQERTLYFYTTRTKRREKVLKYPDVRFWSIMKRVILAL